MKRVPATLIAALVGAALASAGCGGSGEPGQDAARAPEGYGVIVVTVDWPTEPEHSAVLSAACESVQVEVSGPGLEAPITSAINAPTTTGRLVVPAGGARLVDATGFDARDAGGSAIQRANPPVLLPHVADAGTYRVTLSLTDL